MERERVPLGGGTMAEGLRKMFVQYVNVEIKRGNENEFKFKSATSSISRSGVHVHCFTEVHWLAVF